MFQALRRKAKVMRIQQALRVGRYRIDEAAVAEAILRRLAQDSRMKP